MFLVTDFASAQYISPKGGIRAAEPLVYAFMAWNLSMWFFVAADVAVVLAAGSAKEQRQFALMRTVAVLASLYLMHSEAAITVPSELSKGYVGQSLALTALVVAGFGDKIKPKSKSKSKAKAKKPAAAKISKKSR
jgi:hypothetical protein